MDLTIYTDDKKPVELSDLIFIIISELQTKYVYPCLFINKLWNKCVHKTFYDQPNDPFRDVRAGFIQSAICHGDEKIIKFAIFIIG